MSVVLPIKSLNTFEREANSAGTNYGGHPTAYARAAAEHERKVEALRNANTGPFECPECHQMCATKQGLGAHRSRSHGVAGTTRKPAQADAAPAPAVEPVEPSGVMSSADFIKGVVAPVLGFEVEPTTDEIIRDVREELLETRSELVEYALRDVLGIEGADRFMNDWVWPLVEAAERAGEAAAWTGKRVPV